MNPAGFAVGTDAVWTVDQPGGATRFDGTEAPATPFPGDIVGGEYAAVLGSNLWTTGSTGDLVGHKLRSGAPVGDPYHYAERACPLAAGFGRLWIANTDYSKIDPATSSGRWMPPRMVPSRPISIATAFQHVWTTLDTGQVIRLDPDDIGQVEIDTHYPDSEAMAASPTQLWVLHSKEGVATAIDPARGAPTGQAIAVGSDPKGFAVDATSVWAIRVDPVHAGSTDVQRYDVRTGRSLGNRILNGYPVGIGSFRDGMVVVTDFGATLLDGLNGGHVHRADSSSG